MTTPADGISSLKVLEEPAAGELLQGHRVTMYHAGTNKYYVVQVLRTMKPHEVEQEYNVLS